MARPLNELNSIRPTRAEDVQTLAAELIVDDEGGAIDKGAGPALVVTAVAGVLANRRSGGPAPVEDFEALAAVDEAQLVEAVW